MKRTASVFRLSLTLCLINWAFFSLFVVLRRPDIDQTYEVMKVEREWEFAALPSGQPVTHIAGRPLHSWNSWHGGESPFVKILEVVNAPALLLAHCLAPAASRLLFTRSNSYYMESWVKAWLFVASSTGQWIAIAWVVARLPQVKERITRKEKS